MRVLLLHMPWGAIERPALGLSLLEAGLQRRGIESRTLYLNLLLADRLGASTYNWITHDLPHIAFAGDWLFTSALYGSDDARDRGYLQQVLRGTWQLPQASIARLLSARASIEAFMAEALQAADWHAFDVVGFTSTFEQNIAALALARRLKALHPQLATVFGGANWEGEMGQALHRAFAFVDYVCSGEADESFPRLLAALAHPARGAAQRTRQLLQIGGIVFRDHRGDTMDSGPGQPIEAMDALPVPSYQAYFDARERSRAAQEVAPVLLFEASRGCWWGAKSHCTFCGLNGHSMGYRSKSPPRLLAELSELIARWPCPSIEAVDNILDMGYFNNVLPALEKLELPGPVFFEVKANLKRHHVAQLARAQVLRIQPGIESLSDHVLALMRKGTTALRNVQLLKWCREYGVSVDWNLLYGFPGETDADYEHIAALLPLIAHLQAPGACGSIRLDRFSPYFKSPQDFGLCRVRALPVYGFLYPAELLDVDQVAYYFEFDYSAGVRPSARAQHAVSIADALRDTPDAATLQALPHMDGGLVLRDTRALARQPTLRFDATERCILERIDELASPAQVLRACEAAFPGLKFESTQIVRFLDYLVASGIALRETRADAVHYLGLAIMPRSMRAQLEARSRRHASLGDIVLAAPHEPALALD